MLNSATANMASRRRLPRLFPVAALSLVVVTTGFSMAALRLNLEKKIVTLGGPGADTAQRFGSIQDVDVDEGGNIYILDSELNQIRLFNSDGKLLSQVGRPGRAPGELAVPMSMEIDKGGNAHVFDAMNQRISTFARNAKGLTFKTALDLKISGSDMCQLGNRYYVVGLRGDKLVHEFSSDGKHVQSFGEAIGGSHPVVRDAMSRGHILCLPRERQIVVASSTAPDVRAYTISGTLLWTMQLSRYRQVMTTIVSPKSVSFSKPPGGNHVTLAAVAASPNVLVVQLGLLSSEPDNRDGFVRIETRMLSVDSGKEIGEQRSLPRLAKMRGSHVLTFDAGHTEGVSLYRFSLQQER